MDYSGDSMPSLQSGICDKTGSLTLLMQNGGIPSSPLWIIQVDFIL